jgi:hypothetical protein
LEQLSLLAGKVLKDVELTYNKQTGKVLKDFGRIYYRLSANPLIDFLPRRVEYQRNQGRSARKSALIFPLIRAGLICRLGLIFSVRRADFPNFIAVTFSRESVTIFSANCDYFLGPVLLLFRMTVTVWKSKGIHPLVD